jgi:hypothetical protein
MMINKKLGYYTVGNQEFDSKLQACFLANQVNQEVKWHFNDEVFKNYNWQIEPEESLDTLYDQRARQLREDYDYIIISYSAGSDSHNIVESFLRQELHIDELVINTMESANKNTTVIDPTNKNPENAAAEHYLQTLPRLQEIKNRSPNTKIEILDLSDYLLNSWLEVGDASWVMDKREGLNPLNVTRFNYLHFSKIRKQFDKGKKIALILGIEKPRTFIYSNNKFYVKFTDRAANIITIENHIKEYSNAVVEYFYWSPEGVRLLCKQAHVIKRWLELNPHMQTSWYHSNLDMKTYRLVHERLLRTLIYSTWDNAWYQADKATKDWYSEFDSWFIDGFKGTRQHNIWKEGIDYVTTQAGQYVDTTKGYSDGLKVFSQHYLVGDMKTNVDFSK